MGLDTYTDMQIRKNQGGMKKELCLGANVVVDGEKVCRVVLGLDFGEFGRIGTKHGQIQHD